MSVIKMFGGISFRGFDYTDLPNGRIRTPSIYYKDLDSLIQEMNADNETFYGGQLQVIRIDLNHQIKEASTLSSEVLEKGIEHTFGMIPFDVEGNLPTEEEANWILIPCPHGNIFRYGQRAITEWSSIVSKDKEEYLENHPSQEEVFSFTENLLSKLMASLPENVFLAIQSASDSDIVPLHPHLVELQAKGLHVSMSGFEKALAELGIQDLTEEELVFAYNQWIKRP